MTQSGDMEAAENLLRRIAVAFAGVPRPRITHHVARGYDDEWLLSEERVAELAMLDPEQSWTEVPDEAIRCFQECFCFSDAEGWRFYLPAHMSYCLRHFADCDHDAVYLACDGEFGDRLELLTSEQMGCVLDFVSLVHAHNSSKG